MGSAGGQRGKGLKNRGITKDPVWIERVALAKFPPYRNPPHRSDREVAEELGLSLEAVGALVKAAFERGVVSPLFNLEPEQREVARLENEVRARFGLQRVLLIPGLPDMLSDLDVMQRRSVQTHVIRSMVQSVRAHLDTALAAAAKKRDGFMLGVAWGRTMWEMVAHLRNTTHDVQFPGLEVVPIVGITCSSMRDPTEANVVAMHLAKVYGGQSSQLACPAFVPKDDAWAVKRLDQVRHMLHTLPSCEMVITSMGPIPDDENGAEQVRVSADPEVNLELFKAARNGKAVGEICGWMFDENGEEVKTNLNAIGLGFARLRKIAADPKRQVILIAGGDRRRLVPIRAALRGRLASVLVSDTITARFLVDDPFARSLENGGGAAGSAKHELQ